jgi:hypothetical protein
VEGSDVRILQVTHCYKVTFKIDVSCFFGTYKDSRGIGIDESIDSGTLISRQGNG